MKSSSDYAKQFIATAILYAIAGMGLGLYQHLTKQFQYIPLHGHLNSLGWLSLAALGLIHRAYPRLAQGKLALVHFWLAQAGVLLLNGGLVLIYAHMSRAPIYIGTVLTPLSFILFLVMFLRAAKGEPHDGA